MANKRTDTVLRIFWCASRGSEGGGWTIRYWTRTGRSREGDFFSVTLDEDKLWNRISREINNQNFILENVKYAPPDKVRKTEPMPARREDVDLFLVLTDPKAARAYIRNFSWDMPADLIPREIVTNTGRVILFKSMTDDDAVAAALELARSIEVPRAEIEAQLAPYEH